MKSRLPLSHMDSVHVLGRLPSLPHPSVGVRAAPGPCFDHGSVSGFAALNFAHRLESGWCPLPAWSSAPGAVAPAGVSTTESGVCWG